MIAQAKTPNSRLSCRLPTSLAIFLLLSAALDFICLAVEAINRYVLHLPFIYTFPFIKFSKWIDLESFRDRFAHFHQLDFFSLAPEFGPRYMYPAPAALLYRFFYLVHHPFRLFFILTFVLVLILLTVISRVISCAGLTRRASTLFLGACLLLSYPFWFEYLLGNLELCIFLVVAFGVVAFLRDRPYLAAVLFGVAAAMKIYPFVYLALLFSQKRYRAIAVGIVTATSLNIVSLWLICPSLAISYHGVEDGLAAFRFRYMLAFLPVETGFDHSLFALYKRFEHVQGVDRLAPETVTVYLAIAAFVGLALYLFRIRHLPALNQLLCLCIASILLPPTSHDYTLLHLYIPWALFVILAVRRNEIRVDARIFMSVFVCFAILFSAESEFISHGTGYGGQIKALTLLVLFLIGLRYPFESSFDQTLFQSYAPAQTH